MKALIFIKWKKGRREIKQKYQTIKMKDVNQYLF